MKAFHFLATFALLLSCGAFAQAAAATEAAQAAVAAAPMTDGEVRKVDLAQGKVTLRHGPISNLEMPGMTMVFRVTEPKMLEGLKQGDKVKFAADRVNGAITVTAIEAAK